MTSFRTLHATSLRALEGAVVALALALVAGTAQAAVPQDTTLSKEDKVCLDCHAKPGLRKTLANGGASSLYIAPDDFAQSMHNSSGCEGCHSDIDVKTHSKPGKAGQAAASPRGHSVALQETCRDCHKKTMKKYDDSVHAALVREGSAKAPLCANCHNPHATRSAKEGHAGSSGVVCQECHKPLSEAFAMSVHGASGGEALECKDCHRTHDIKAATTGDHLKGQCISCHREVATSHATWLPNTARHLEAIACPACHSPGATRRVDLRLYQGIDGSKAAEKLGVPQFFKLAGNADPKGEGVDARALWSLLQDFNRDGTEGKTFVRGRLEVQTPIESHSLSAKGQAVKDCATCHKQGATAFQNVTISVVGPDGRPQRHDASRGILSSAESIGSVGGFYAIGGTRIKLLDTMLLMALAGGILLPAGHLTVKLAVQRRRLAEAAAAAAAAAEASAATPAEPTPESAPGDPGQK